MSSRPAPTVYECPHCRCTVTLRIEPKYPPCCPCRRGKQVTQMRVKVNA